MNNIDFINLLYEYLEKRPYNNFYENAQQDAEYIKASILESRISRFKITSVTQGKIQQES